MNTEAIKQDLVKKIRGLITFGSPLDKIAFFFREHTPEEQSIRRQILPHFHGFKSRNLNLQENELKVENPIRPLLDDTKWINIWDKKDPISGQLDFYKNVKNILPYTMDAPYGISHNEYWKYRKMYTDICEHFFKK